VTVRDPRDDDGLAAPGEAVSAVSDPLDSDPEALTPCFVIDVDGFDESNGPPEHDPGCACGHCPDWSW
jgi:hypothetical protein